MNAIYEYVGDNGETKRIDPVRVLEVLTFAANGDLAGVVRASDSPADDIAEEARIKLDLGTRLAFGLSATTKTPGEVAEMLEAFFVWQDEKKKPDDSTPILPDATGPIA